MNKYSFLAMSCVLMGAWLCSCMDSADDEEKENQIRRQENIEWYEAQKSLMVDGVKYYETYAPIWAQSNEILIHWHNNRRLTEKNLVPLSNSTVDIKYDVSLIDGKRVDSSYNRTQYGDSIYRTKPSSNILGMHALLTTMHEGDSVTCVIPAASAYGQIQSGDILPYSTLIFNVKLVDVKAWEKPI